MIISYDGAQICLTTIKYITVNSAHGKIISDPAHIIIAHSSTADC